MAVEPSSTSSYPSRRTRIVCISDTHNCTIKLPKGDVLIHAGDLTNQGSYSELSKTMQWLEKADFEAKIVIAGNHDITLDHEFYSQHWQSFQNQNSKPQDTARCLSLLTSSPTITYLRHSSATIRLDDPKGPRTEFTVFGSPYCPRSGKWAFGYDCSDLDSAADSPSRVQQSSYEHAGPKAADIWADVPANTDIVVTHTPPRNHCDALADGRALGCEELRRALWRVRPRLHVCGHVHHGRGAERVTWEEEEEEEEDDEKEEADNPNNGPVRYGEASVEQWEDPSPDAQSGKICLVDLTSRGKNWPSHQAAGAGSGAGPGAARPPAPPGVSCSSTLPQSETEHPTGPIDRTGRGDDDHPGPSRATSSGLGSHYLGRGGCLGGQAAVPLVDQMGRRRRRQRQETCVVNCAVMATNWPHVGARQLNKAIVVDLDLPVWRP
ncbi:Metallo-dependent phosphatase-like protein [Bombardia bombarda]|uniref:Metallo-dependent phosphatase-like protein n=1 Tax=Bombardia bombarda TaxID=252184 RepID=A0AA39XNH3_9PEZI|nr:Metallo-dependent phosphatase-like protein [Bombardia bombarda]